MSIFPSWLFPCLGFAVPSASFSACFMFFQFCQTLYLNFPILLFAEDFLEILILGLTVASMPCSKRHSSVFPLIFRCLSILHPWHFIIGTPPLYYCVQRLLFVFL